MDIMINNSTTTPQELGNHDQYEYDDDDAFYAELERRVLSLIDDHHHDHKQIISTHKYSSSNSIFTAKQRCVYSVKQSSNYFYWSEKKGGDDLVPAAILNSWGPHSNSKGTGVFIPRIANSRTRNKPRRKGYNKGVVHKDIGS